MYSGLELTWAKIRPIYSPIIPRNSRLRPPKKVNAVARVAQPGRSLPVVNRQIITLIPYKIAKNETMNPLIVASRNGMRLNPKIPSDASPKSLKKLYLVFPEIRCLRSY